jgi:hypothetical protein
MNLWTSNAGLISLWKYVSKIVLFGHVHKYQQAIMKVDFQVVVLFTNPCFVEIVEDPLSAIKR